MQTRTNNNYTVSRPCGTKTLTLSFTLVRPSDKLVPGLSLLIFTLAFYEMKWSLEVLVVRPSVSCIPPYDDDVEC